MSRALEKYDKISSASSNILSTLFSLFQEQRDALHPEIGAHLLHGISALADKIRDIECLMDRGRVKGSISPAREILMYGIQSHYFALEDAWHELTRTSYKENSALQTFLGNTENEKISQAKMREIHNKYGKRPKTKTSQHVKRVSLDPRIPWSHKSLEDLSLNIGGMYAHIALIVSYGDNPVDDMISCVSGPMAKGVVHFALASLKYLRSSSKEHLLIYCFTQLFQNLGLDEEMSKQRATRCLEPQ